MKQSQMPTDSSTIHNPIEKYLLQVPLEHPCFADHFPGEPLVPGALLLKWIFTLLSEQAGYRITYIKQLKFLAALRPGDQLELWIKLERRINQRSSTLLLIEGYLNTVIAIKGQCEIHKDHQSDSQQKDSDEKDSNEKNRDEKGNKSELNHD